MLIVLNRDLEEIKRGWAARNHIIGVAAHGPTPELADKNLERLARLFFSSFERQGTLAKEVEDLGLEWRENQGTVVVALTDPTG